MVAISQSINCTPSGLAVLLSGDYTTSNISYRFNSSDESITYTNGVGWQDLGSNRPFSLSSATGPSITLNMGWGNITLPNPYNVNNIEVGYADPNAGPTVTHTRTAHTGSIPFANNFTIRSPTGLSYDKIAAKKFRLKFYDQNEIATYNLTVSWTTATGTDNTVIQLTSGAGDLQIDVEPTNIVNGSITLSINTAVFAMTNFGMMEIGANNVFDTFTYYETGPFTSSFSPNFGLPGQSISYTVTDTNQYPDTESTFSVKHGNNAIGNGTLVNTHNYSTSNTNAFVSQHGTYTITINENVIASANYDTNYVASTTTSNGGGKPDRYPLIMTNLFNRNRSVYSIGMTHKDTWDLFL